MKPWCEGPLELLNHAEEHLRLGSDFDNRIAMTSIDNSVELMIKTYLGLPPRVNKIKLSRKKYEEIIESFPSLIEVLEKHASKKIIGINLEDIEWYHRIRNKIYHDANGITIEKMRVEAYLEIAKVLFSNLFEVPLEELTPEEPENLLNNFILKWVETEHELLKFMVYHNISENATLHYAVETLCEKKILPSSFLSEFQELRNLRNNLLHGDEAPPEKELEIALKKLHKMFKIIKEKYKSR